ncbi:MAG: hypothetical protein SW833_00610 [Cyanobacteriota bacterium]|nr:hypothetical protein [Cyanobacteriota bacterium]
MNIELSSEDLRQMPPTLATGLLNWLQCQRLKPSALNQSAAPDNAEQLSLKLVEPSIKPRKSHASETVTAVKAGKSPKHPQIRLSQLFDAGITKAGMAVRVKLKAEKARTTGHDYVTKDLKISQSGTVIYNEQEFNKPSPLAQEVNGSSANGWEYVQVKKNGQWVSLNELRQVWRKSE